MAIEALILFICGVSLWPVLEYVLHRFSGHEIGIPKIFYTEHSTHHQKHHYFAPAWKKSLAAVGVLSFLTLINSLWLPAILSLTFSAGVVSMYLFYEWTHYSFHKFEPKTRIGLILRKHHFSHHFHHPKYNHGVTTNWLDRVFGTYRYVETVKIPKNFQMAWLLDQNGNLKSKWSKDFQIK